MSFLWAYVSQEAAGSVILSIHQRRGKAFGCFHDAKWDSGISIIYKWKCQNFCWSVAICAIQLHIRSSICRWRYCNAFSCGGGECGSTRLALTFAKSCVWCVAWGNGWCVSTPASSWKYAEWEYWPIEGVMFRFYIKVTCYNEMIRTHNESIDARNSGNIGK
jgi:hypothetical protein